MDQIRIKINSTTNITNIKSIIMKNKIVLIVISLFLLCFNVKANSPKNPSATADRSTFSLYLDQMREVRLTLVPDDGYSIEGLRFEIEGDTTAIRITEGDLIGGNLKFFTVTGLKPGTHEITIIIKGRQRSNSIGLAFEFTIEVKLIITVKKP